MLGARPRSKREEDSQLVRGKRSFADHVGESPDGRGLLGWRDQMGVKNGCHSIQSSCSRDNVGLVWIGGREKIKRALLVASVGRENEQGLPCWFSWRKRRRKPMGRRKSGEKSGSFHLKGGHARTMENWLLFIAGVWFWLRTSLSKQHVGKIE